MNSEKPIDYTYQIWRHVLLFIFIGLSMRTINDGFHGDPILGYVTNMGILSITTILCGLYFEKTRDFTSRYLVFAGFGLAWTIFAIRFTFPVVSDVNWFQQLFKRMNYDFPAPVGRFGDFLIHVLPLLVYYAILYIHGKTLKEMVNQHPIWKKLIIAYSPYALICLWTVFHNAYETYGVPDNMATRSILYIGIPILLLLTSSRPIFLMHTPIQVKITYIVQACGLFIGILLGVHIFGVVNLTNSVVSYTCTILLAYLLLRIIKGNTHKWLSYWFLPVLGLIAGQVVCRELYFIVTGESHHHFIEMARPDLANASYWYSLYLVLTYVFIFSTTSTLLASDFPKDISIASPVRIGVIEARKNCKTPFKKVLHEIWHTFGGVFLIGGFMLINFNSRYDLGLQSKALADLGIETKVLSDAVFLISFMIIGYTLPGIFYRRNIKKIADKVD